MLPNLVTWGVQELLIIILTMVHNEAQLAAYAILLIFPNLLNKVSEGFQTSLIKRMNISLGRRRFQSAKDQFWVYCSFMLTLLAFFSCLISGATYLISSLYADTNEVKKWLQVSMLPLGVYVFLASSQVCIQNVMISFEHRTTLFWLNFAFGLVIRVPLTYLMVVVWNYQLLGFFYASIITQIYVVIMIVIVAQTDFKGFIGVKN